MKKILILVGIIILAVIFIGGFFAYQSNVGIKTGNKSVNKKIIIIPPAENINGVYAYNNIFNYQTGKINSSILSNPSIDGVVAYFDWSALEPKDGVYDWSQIDAFISQAKNAGKKVAIAIHPGYKTPLWVYGEGAKSIQYIWDEGWGPKYCTPELIPVPWDPIYLSKWVGFIKAFGARYNSEPSISHIEASGINSRTPEIFLPFSKAAPINSGQCESNNYVAEWQAVGYTRTKLENAWYDMADAWNTAFSDKFWGPIVVPGGFPPIDDNGNIIPKATKDYQVTSDILNSGFVKYGSRFVAQNNGLSDFWISPEVDSLANKISTGHQALWSATNDTSCRMNNHISPCDPVIVLQGTVSKGIGAGAKFIEIYGADILNPSLNGIIKTAHQDLNK